MPYSMFVGALRAQKRKRISEQRQMFLMMLNASHPTKQSAKAILKGFDDEQQS